MKPICRTSGKTIYFKPLPSYNFRYLEACPLIPGANCLRNPVWPRLFRGHDSGAFEPRPLKDIRAFTLIEIIVVLSLIGTMLFFALPRMEGFREGTDRREVSKWILLNIAHLKNKAVETQTQHVLFIDLDTNRFRIAMEKPAIGSDNTEDASRNGFDDPPPASSGEHDRDPLGPDDARREAEEKTYELPQGFRLGAVHYSADHTVTSGTAEIRFHPKGYSDRAIIHLTDRRNRRQSYLVEAFLPHVTIHDEHITFQ